MVKFKEGKCYLCKGITKSENEFINVLFNNANPHFFTNNGIYFCPVDGKLINDNCIDIAEGYLYMYDFEEIGFDNSDIEDELDRLSSDRVKIEVRPRYLFSDNDILYEAKVEMISFNRKQMTISYSRSTDKLRAIENAYMKCRINLLKGSDIYRALKGFKKHNIRF